MDRGKSAGRVMNRSACMANWPGNANRTFKILSDIMFRAEERCLDWSRRRALSGCHRGNVLDLQWQNVTDNVLTLGDSKA